MAWWNPFDLVKGVVGEARDAVGVGEDDFNRINRAEELYGGVDSGGDVGRTARQMGGFGRQGMQDFQNTRQLDANQRQMGQVGHQFGRLGQQYGRIAQGMDSISAEQLRQGLEQNIAGQRSMAAGAAPQNAAMAARTAAINAGRMGAGMSGQAAMAGLQERRDALGAQMGAMQGQGQMQGLMQQGLMGQRGQNLQAGLGGMQGAMQGYGSREANRTARYGSVAGTPTPGEQWGGMLASGLQAYAKGG